MQNSAKNTTTEDQKTQEIGNLIALSVLANKVVLISKEVDRKIVSRKTSEEGRQTVHTEVERD